MSRQRRNCIHDKPLVVFFDALAKKTKLVEIRISYHIIKARVIFLFIYMIDVKGQGTAFHNHSLYKVRTSKFS